MAAKIGAAMAGGKIGSGVDRPRQHGDWYPTPANVSQVVMDHVKFDGPVWEPCCGDGSMARVVEHYGHTVYGTDLHDRGYGIGHGEAYNLLKAERLLAPNVITNPPFDIAAEIIEHMMVLRPKKMALLLKASFWHAKSRHKLFEAYRPSKILALTWRPDFMHLKRPTMEVSWFIWEDGFNGETTYTPVAKPDFEIKIPDPSFVLSRAA